MALDRLVSQSQKWSLYTHAGYAFGESCAVNDADVKKDTRCCDFVTSEVYTVERHNLIHDCECFTSCKTSKS